MNKLEEKTAKPEILAPAGNRDAFLAALAAGADAIYCGLRQFSARMEAKNFPSSQLESLVRLAQDRGTRVYVTFNTLIKPGELEVAAGILNDLAYRIKPDGVIIQDPGVRELIRQTAYKGEVHLSTLANVTFPDALQFLKKKFTVDRVVVPRELNIDEIKTMAAACPTGLALEVFVHGALCYGVSGRCYWSSYMGGKSGLRGRCVQPCRRLYTQGKEAGKRYFSCQDLSLDVLVKVLNEIPEIAAWKIEGRKKGPHYVYYTTRAYRLLRDEGRDPVMKRTALGLLERSLGRTGTHYHFLPQRPQNPVDVTRQTGSGFFMGVVKGPSGKPFITPKEELLFGDILRVGYEDGRFHAVYKIRKQIPKNGKFYLKSVAGKTTGKGTPVFLIDRRETALTDMIDSLAGSLVERSRAPQRKPSPFPLRLPKRTRVRMASREFSVHRRYSMEKRSGVQGVWLSENALSRLPSGAVAKSIWWLPPVIWPENAEALRRLVDRVRRKGGRHFFLNAPWQIGMFSNPDKMQLWAGPFCNLTNPFALKAIANLGFIGAVISPELGADDILALPNQSPLPLGIVVSGNWPLCISRVVSERIALEEPFSSPRGEQAWASRYGSDYWLFPNWELDLKHLQRKLEKAGYRVFIHLKEPVPKTVKMKKRPGIWNWKVELA